VDWLIWMFRNIHADIVRMRTSSPPLPSPYPRALYPALAIPTHSPFAPSLIPNRQQLITLRVEMLLNERFPMLAPWGKEAPRNRRWDSILMNKFKNERNLGLESKHINTLGQVSRNGLSLAEMLNVNVGAALAPAGVGSLESDATALQPCSVSAASGRSSSSLPDSRKRPRAQEDAGGSGEDVEEDSAAIIARALKATLDKRQQASTWSARLTLYILHPLNHPPFFVVG